MEKPMRRNSAAGRGVNAANQSALLVTPSPSPLIALTQPLKASLPVIKRIDPRIFEADVDTEESPSRVLELRKRLAELQPVVPTPNSLGRLSSRAMAIIAEFAATDDVKAVITLSRVCRALYIASLHVLSTVMLCPDVVTIAQLSRPGAMASLAQFFAATGRGQHVLSLTIMRPKYVYSLPNTVKGPEVHATDLARVVMQLRHLTYLDVRGVVHRCWAQWCDRLLADLPGACPKLRVLRIGAAYLATWEPGWWAGLPSLEELIVGSRREDAIWAVGSPATLPATLPDDLFVMLRTAPLQRLKIWIPLVASSFTGLLLPTQPVTHLQHITVNATGNTELKPLDDAAAREAETAKETQPAKGAAGKGGKATAKAQDDAASGPKVMFPALSSVTLSDVKERPEFAVELMVKMMPMAPAVQHWNVANSHRNAPGRAPPVQAGRGRAAGKPVQ
jgi:hypothetical protein